MSSLFRVGANRLKLLSNQVIRNNWLLYQSIISFSDDTSQDNDSKLDETSNKETTNGEENDQNSKKSENDNLIEQENSQNSDSPDEVPKEIDGPKGPEPTRYGDWEKGGRCYDF